MSAGKTGFWVRAVQKAYLLKYSAEKNVSSIKSTVTEAREPFELGMAEAKAWAWGKVFNTCGRIAKVVAELSGSSLRSELNASSYRTGGRQADEDSYDINSEGPPLSMRESPEPSRQASAIPQEELKKAASGLRAVQAAYENATLPAEPKQGIPLMAVLDAAKETGQEAKEQGIHGGTEAQGAGPQVVGGAQSATTVHTR